MKFIFSTWFRILLVLFAFAIAVYGFMIKLPSGFRHIDKELHSAFYFAAAAFLNFIFLNKKLIWHMAIFAFLYLFGMCIELAQEYSNKLTHTRIHGRYDPEDVAANLKGLIAFSAVWLAIVLLIAVYPKLKTGEQKSIND